MLQAGKVYLNYKFLTKGFYTEYVNMLINNEKTVQFKYRQKKIKSG